MYIANAGYVDCTANSGGKIKEVTYLDSAGVETQKRSQWLGTDILIPGGYRWWCAIILGECGEGVCYQA